VLNERYDLSNRPAQGVTMDRGKPIQEGVRVKLPAGVTWEGLAAMSPDQIRDQNLFPKGFYPLPHPNHPEGGFVFPHFLIDAIKQQDGRDLKRFDLDFDLPDHFLAGFPPAMYLTQRTDLGDVSQGKLVSLTNYYQLFNGILTPRQLEGLRLLLTPFPQQQFNATEDRRSELPSQGAACFDCHSNGHQNGATHLAPDARPEWFRHRIKTISLRGLNIQRLFGSQRALKTVEDFTEFEQRTAYFDGDTVIASKKGVNPLERGSQVDFMADIQEMLDFPPAPKLDVFGKLDPARATQAEMRGQEIFFGKGQRGLPSAALLHRQSDAQPADRALLQAGDDQQHDGRRRRTDQNLCLARRQRQPALHARRAPSDVGGHGRVLQPDPRHQAGTARETGFGGLYARALTGSGHSGII
jgi:cytochrome c peroxidase